jgi:FAD/FMN-containing dehydrogenase
MREGIGALETIVGAQNVLDDPAVLEQYSSDLSFVPSIRPRCVVKPTTSVQVQDLVKWANETMTPLVPVSSGSPHFRGDTVPSMGGAVIVDLSDMKKIVRINPTDRVAMVEPGVTFGELQQELKKAGLSAYLPLCPRASKSVMGSMLEREPITVPSQHWDSLDPFLCAEIIFGTGDKLRSGEAAGPDSIEEQWKIGKSQMVPFGLGQFDESRLISGAQGTIGITTWATLKCRPAPKLTETFLITSEVIDPLIDLSYRLMRVRLGETCFIVNDLTMASLLEKEAEEIKTLRGMLPRWMLVLTFEGNGPLPEEKVAYQVADFKEMLAKEGNLKVVNRIGSFSADDVAEMLTMPSAEPYWKLRYKGACEDLFFLTTLDKTPGFIGALPALMQTRRLSAEDVGIYIQPIVQGTSCHMEFEIFYDSEDAPQKERVRSVITEGAVELANMGAFFSRPYGPWAEIAYGRATETNILQRKVKKIFDPNNVLNPGKLCF